MTTGGLTRRFILLRALRWLPLGLVLPFLVITPQARGLSIGAIGVVFAVHSAVAIVLEVPSGALADLVERRWAAAREVGERSARHLKHDRHGAVHREHHVDRPDREAARLRRYHEELQHQPERQPPERPEQDEAARQPAGGHAASRRSGNAWNRTIARSVSSRRVRRSA